MDMMRVSAEPASANCFMNTAKPSAMNMPSKVRMPGPLTRETRKAVTMKTATTAHEIARVARSPRKTPTMSSTMPLTARKISGRAGISELILNAYMTVPA
jgi:hypothetical protein